MEFLIRMGKILDNTHKFHFFAPLKYIFREIRAVCQIYIVGFIHTTICNN